eukprot:3869747-Rhodomonas_salina.1
MHRDLIASTSISQAPGMRMHIFHDDSKVFDAMLGVCDRNTYGGANLKARFVARGSALYDFYDRAGADHRSQD